ncbi:hypothetical protein JVU11DRAFT_3513 [Chiua virens]|nr:hypothetical protein JVU11DRAFT_3513 [Chiua virens]
MSNHGPFFPLDVDSTDCLLTTLHNFQSLWGFVVSCKFVYSVFRFRQNTILGAVAHNQFGPALPQAMDVVRRLGGTHASALVYDHQDAHCSAEFVISPSQVRLLRDHAATIQALEDIYSWREKDPRSRISRMSTAESLRFQQSVYRFWLLAAAYGPAGLAYERPDYSSSKVLEFKDSVIAKQMAFLLSLGEKELIGVDEVHSFLLDVANWALTKQNKRAIGTLKETTIIWSGMALAATLDTFMGNQPNFGCADLQWHGTWRAMTHAFNSAEIVSITGGGATSASRQRFILDNLFLETIEYWEYMVLVLPPSRLWSFLLFNRRSPLEFLVIFAEALGSIPYHVFIEEIFDVRSGRYKNWDKDDWLCTHCMSKLLSDNVQTWFDGKIMKGNGSR